MKNDLSEAARALGKKGGSKTLEKYGVDHFRKMGALSGKKGKKKKGIMSRLKITS